VIWDEGSDIKDTTCDMCWNGTSRMDNYEKLCWIGEKVNLAISMWTLASGMGKMWGKVKASDKISWDRMWNDWQFIIEQWWCCIWHGQDVGHGQGI